MVYTFKSGNRTLEIYNIDEHASAIKITRNIGNGVIDSLIYPLDYDDLYDLIGSLHSVKAKMKKEVTDA